jgi:uncharacterized protein YcbX
VAEWTNELTGRLYETSERWVTDTGKRTNFVFSGGQPYEEDRWREFSIGNILFEVTKACVRCVITTINQNTGEKDKEHEPMATLSTYRRREGRVLFGQKLSIIHGEGIIREGDRIRLGTAA